MLILASIDGPCRQQLVLPRVRHEDCPGCAGRGLPTRTQGLRQCSEPLWTDGHCFILLVITVIIPVIPGYYSVTVIIDFVAEIVPGLPGFFALE